MNNIKLKIIIYVLTFVATCVLTFIFAIDKSENSYKVNNSTMGNANLPIIYMTTEQGTTYNYLHGYTCEVQRNLIHDCISPIDSERNMSITVKQYGTTVSGISYELRSIDGSTLIERADVADFQSFDGTINTSFKFKNLMDSGREYLLMINVNTETAGEVTYYTRVIILDDADLDKKISFINSFSNDIMSEETLENVVPRISPDSTGINNNLGTVNLHSKLAQIGYAGMEIKATSSKYITINEIDGKRASMTINFTAENTDETGTHSYDIKEYFRINRPDDSIIYVYNYDRWMDQTFDPDCGVSSTGEIYFGICSDNEVEMKASDNGKMTCFVRDNKLWLYNIRRNEFTEVFSFASNDSDGLREGYDQHAIKILKVGDEGDVSFLVYGYMNRGTHEGNLGISVFNYNSESGYSTEIGFISRTDTYMSIAKDINTLAYINDKNILYMYNKGSIYYVDCTTKECMIVATDVISTHCIMHEATAMLMYQTGDSPYDSQTLNILRPDTGEIYKIEVTSSERIMALGYIDDNAIYGVADKSMIMVTEDGNTVFPMKKLYVIDQEYKVVRTYEADDKYITSVEIDAGSITLNRVVLNDNGNVVPTTSDMLLSNVEETKAVLTINTRATDLRQRENYLALISSGATGKVSSKTVKYTYPSDAAVNIIDTQSKESEYFYAYGFGGLYRICDSMADAIDAAYESGGVVVDSSSEIIWTRYKTLQHTIKNLPDSVMEPSENSQVAATNALIRMSGKDENSAFYYDKGYTILQCLEEVVGKTINLTGADLEKSLFYVSEGYPIIVKVGEDRYELLYEYLEYTVSTVDLTTGTLSNYSYNEFNKIISQYGKVMITAIY